MDSTLSLRVGTEVRRDEGRIPVAEVEGEFSELVLVIFDGEI